MRAWLLLPLLAACETAPVYLPTPEDSVKPGINTPYLDPRLDVQAFTERFEGESREVYVAREAIVEAIGLDTGDIVADVGAGTGLFLGYLSRAVGDEGRVVAVDIAEPFIAHLNQRAEDEGLGNVDVRLCGEASVDLPARSVDLMFLCDVYHHFEFPRSTMGSIHFALREGGEVIVVDFERIPGVTRPWVLGHVRAGKDEVIREMESFGFELVELLDVEGLEENWVGRFRRS